MNETEKSDLDYLKALLEVDGLWKDGDFTEGGVEAETLKLPDSEMVFEKIKELRPVAGYLCVADEWVMMPTQSDEDWDRLKSQRPLHGVFCDAVGKSYQLSQSGDQWKLVTFSLNKSASDLIETQQFRGRATNAPIAFQSVWKLDKEIVHYSPECHALAPLNSNCSETP